MLNEDQIIELEKIAAENDGHCDRCHRLIKIYKYTVNKQMLAVLSAMRKEIDSINENKVVFSNLSLPYALSSQRTKMRLHGLIAKYEENGVHVSDTWLITKKGGDFLRGTAIEKTVVVFDNQLLGHEGGMIDRYRLDKTADYQEEAITTPEAEVYSDVREPKKLMTVTAMFKGRDYTGDKLITGQEYELSIERLQVGKPVKVREPFERIYGDISAFYNDWRIIK